MRMLGILIGLSLVAVIAAGSAANWQTSGSTRRR